MEYSLLEKRPNRLLGMGFFKDARANSEEHLKNPEEPQYMDIMNRFVIISCLWSEVSSWKLVVGTWMLVVACFS